VIVSSGGGEWDQFHESLTVAVMTMRPQITTIMKRLSGIKFTSTPGVDQTYLINTNFNHLEFQYPSHLSSQQQQ